MPLARRLIPAALLVLALAAASCDPVGGYQPSSDGGDASSVAARYVGDTVSFRVEDGQAGSFRLQGVECRIPHPLDPEVVTCRVPAPGLPAGTLPVVGGSFSGDLGGVQLAGTLDGEAASGTWRFEASCPDETPCTAEGDWTAVRIAEPDPVGPDAQTDTGGPEDVLEDTTPGPDVPIDPDVPVTPDVPPVGTPPGATAAQVEAAQGLAALRARVGLPTPDQSAGVNAASQAHADYYALHAQDYAASGLSPHREDPAWEEGFTGVTVTERLNHQGVSFTGWSEVMAFTGGAQAALDGWMATLYHREPLVHPNLGPWGFGLAEGGVRCEVLDTLRGPAATDEPVPWPPPDATGVDTSWSGLEAPQPPLPAGESYPSGPIVTLTFRHGVDLALESARLLAPSGGEVPAVVRTPEDDPFLASSWSLYAHDPLDGGATYTVVFEGTVDDVPTPTTWSFTTR